MEFSTTTRGNEALLYKGFEYTKFRTNKCGVSSWRCRLSQRSKCPALLKMVGTEILGDEPAHSHDSDPSKAKAKLLTSRMKEAMKETGASPRVVMETVLKDVSPHVLDKLPSHSMLSQHLHRTLRESRAGSTLVANPPNVDFEMPQDYSDLILYDTGKGTDRILAVGDLEMVGQLAQDVIFGDGTYDQSPDMFFELFTFHAQVGSAHPACVYFLLAKKDLAIYTRMFDILKQLCQDMSPKEIIIDFDWSLFVAAHDAFPMSVIRGSYFHLQQSISQKIKLVGLQAEYDADGDLKLALKSLAALAFVPPGDVDTQFHELVVTFPPNDKRYLDVINHFVTNFLFSSDSDDGDTDNEPVFPMDNWNHHVAAASMSVKSSNCCQHIHNTLNSIFHITRRKTVWHLFNCLRKDMDKQKAVLNKIYLSTLGSNKVDKCKHLAIKVAALVNDYDNEPDKLSYLRNLANMQ